MPITNYKKRFNVPLAHLLGLAFLLTVMVVCAAFTLAGSSDLDVDRQQLLFRKIGHDLLLHSGDSTSRVLPVKRIADNEYQIRFENELTFQPDSLMKIVARSLAKDKLAGNYMVNVWNCARTEVVFGYAISQHKENNIVSCSGRVQPKGCYIIALKFEPRDINSTQKGYLLGGLPLLAFVGWVVSTSVKVRKNGLRVTPAQIEGITIGYTLFDPIEKQLTIAGETISLTTKESKLLQIFALAPNTIIERSRLQKEIWEDEGVIVGRSLDMFISKLRKKLENDPQLKLTNIHGKGYKLEVV